jgi:Fe-S-cluster containining protein
MAESEDDPKAVAVLLLQATALPDERIFTELDAPRYTSVDYLRMACHLLFRCQRCGTCCTTGDPIRLRAEDAALIARHLKIPLSRAIKRYTIPDPERPGVLDFKHIKPCKFYDASGKGCKLYSARPWSCRIFPFIGIYGSENQVKISESCPGSVETMKTLTAALEEARADAKGSAADPSEVRRAKEALRAVLDFI